MGRGGFVHGVAVRLAMGADPGRVDPGTDDRAYSPRGSDPSGGARRLPGVRSAGALPACTGGVVIDRRRRGLIRTVIQSPWYGILLLRDNQHYIGIHWRL